MKASSHIKKQRHLTLVFLSFSQIFRLPINDKFCKQISNMNVSLLYGTKYRKIMSKQHFIDSAGSVVTQFLRDGNLKIIHLLLLLLSERFQGLQVTRGLKVILTDKNGRCQVYGNKCWSHCSVSQNLPNTQAPLACCYLLVEAVWVQSGNWDNTINEHYVSRETMRQQRTQFEITQARKPPLLTVNCKLS